MGNRDVVVICRSKNASLGIKKTSVRGLMDWGSHIRQRYLIDRVSTDAPAERMAARVLGNVLMPEWIGNYRFGAFDLLNYVSNGRKYVYDPGVDDRFFDPIGIPSCTSVALYDYLSGHGYNPINIDNVKRNRSQAENAIRNNPLAVAISATFLGATEVAAVICAVRKISQDVPIIIGSSVLLSKKEPNGRLQEEFEALVSDNVYMILHQYGLDTLDELLQRILSGGDLTNIPDTVVMVDGVLKYNEQDPWDDDLDSHYTDWSSVAHIAKGVAFVRASQGCPYKCKFCTFPKASPAFRERSMESLRAELREVKKAGIRHLAFTDDHFATRPTRIKDICTMMLEEKFDFDWFAGIRSSAIDEEAAELLAATGCNVLCLGIESGDDRVLKLMNKGTTTAGNMKSLEILDRHGITAYGSFILGFPGESRESIDNTINWINSSPLKLYKVFLFMLLPGSTIFDEQVEHNVEFLGEEYGYNLWKTPTLDALEASELLKEFILRVDRVPLIYNYSPMYVFFPLLQKGYSMAEALDFLRIRTELIQNELSDASFLSRARFRQAKYREIESMLR